MKDKELEKAMKRLNEIAALMNDDNLPLEDALKLYAEASELVSACKSEMGGAQAALKEIFMGAD